MSHVHTVIEPADGLTVIAGENNCGKSAVVAAIQCVCSNATGDYMVRHGEKECRVILETDDDQVIEWRRVSKKVSYVVNGETIDRTRGKVPEKAEAALRMCKVEAENEEFDVHFGEQKNPIFLLNGTSGQRAAFFASSSDAAKLIEMQNLHKSKLADCNRNLKEYQKRESNFLLRLEKLRPIKELEEDLEQAKATETQLAHTDQQIQRLQSLLKNLQRETQQQVKCQQVLKSVSGLREPPRLHELGELTKLTDKIGHAQITRAKSLQKLTILSGTPTPPEFADVTALSNLSQALRRSKWDFDYYLKKSVHLQMCEAPTFADLKPMEQRVQQLRATISKVQMLERVGAETAKLEAPRAVESAEPLARQIHSINQAIEDISTLGQLVVAVSQEVETAHAELHQALEQSGTCPTCGQELHLSKADS